VAPDVAYKPTPFTGEDAAPEPPTFVMEMVTPTYPVMDIQRKRLIYVQATILYWEVYPDTQTIDVYAPGQAVQSIGRDGTLDGGAVLPGFRLAAADLWKTFARPAT
jgi:Uma2 family endonuclease